MVVGFTNKREYEFMIDNKTLLTAADGDCESIAVRCIIFLKVTKLIIFCGFREYTNVQNL